MSKLYDDISDLSDHEMALTLGGISPPKLPPRGVHPAVRQLPSMADDEYKSLVEDIRINGQQKAVAMYEGYIWEGRARYDACVELGLIPKVWVLRTKDPVAFWISRNLARCGEPRSEERQAVIDVLSKIDEAEWKASEGKWRAEWIAYGRDEFKKLSKHRQPCAVCGLSEGYSHAHHLLPLNLQYDIGLDNAVHDHEWLCPVHHTLLHRMIGSIVTGTRRGYYHRDGLSVPTAQRKENTAAFAVFDRGLALFSALGGIAAQGNWRLLP